MFDGGIAEININGRQIKNGIKMAQLLARKYNKPLSAEQCKDYSARGGKESAWLRAS